ncbi:AAA family ATPase [Sphingopyxis sp. FD7]|uniref:AAA family ATPase n=1 Tax=Sphingopyxis sp. FD7 TaxID=1914525 RepID=UPI000DC62E77|nr:AAA family ATPase [Sphingopyxis sp. FD7]BBB14252.1 ATPase [Sphingopyxis sp. FD7]
MKVVVFKPSRGTPPALADIVLQQDAWDDFGFKTQYHVFYFAGDQDAFVGNIKILQRGQVETQDSVLPEGPLEPLGDDFCSLGQSLDYYERLAAFPEELRRFLLEFFRDALADPIHAETFEQEKGWRVSVTRDLDLDSYVPLARTLLERDYDALPSMGLDMTFRVAGWQEPLSLDFAAPAQEGIWAVDFDSAKARLPERVAVLTGRNGSGKSTLMARLARVLHASQRDRRSEAILRLGSIEPAGIGFSRVVTVAYSAFDTFQVPGVGIEERRQIAKDLRAGTGRYSFAGLRDIAAELEESLESEGDAIDADSGALDDRIAFDRQVRTRLKSAEQLADEYARTIQAISEAGRSQLLLRVLRPLLADPSFSDIPDQSPMELLALEPKSTFMGWSTGLKIVMHATATLVARTERKSIVLIDEPESHLHPPLLAAFMHSVRLVLKANDAFAVVATHSPVVVQETLGRHVSVVNRVGDEITILPPRIETYGESIGEITDEVFRLHPGATDFHATLKAMVDAGLTTEQIDGRFDRGLSLQARAYVLSLVATRAA